MRILKTIICAAILASAVSACRGGLPVKAATPGRDGAAYKAEDDLTGSLNEALGPVTAVAQPDKGTITVQFTPREEAQEIITRAQNRIGPCVVDGNAYVYYLLRLFDSSGQFVAAAIGHQRPIPCRQPKAFDFSAFKHSPQSVSFTANTAVLRDAKSAEFGILFDVMGPGAEGRLITDRNDVPRAWLVPSPVK